jgi:hypothetical protein
VLHAANRAGLHESISILDVGSILSADETTGKVGIVSENVWVVLSPFEVNFTCRFISGKNASYIK